MLATRMLASGVTGASPAALTTSASKMDARSRTVAARPSRAPPSARPSKTSSHHQHTKLHHTTSTWQAPHTPSTARRGCCPAALPALTAVPLPKPEPSGPGLAPFLADDEASKTSDVALAPPLAMTTTYTTVLGVLIALAPRPPVSLRLAKEYDVTDLRSQGWTWFTLPCPSNPYRTRRDEQAMYVLPSFWLRMKAHLEDRPLYGLY